MIAVRDGGKESVNLVRMTYKHGYATKEDYAKALQSYQAYLDEIRSDQRNEAAAADEDYKYIE